MDAGGSVTDSESTYGGFITSSFLLMTLTDDHIDGRIKCEVGILDWQIISFKHNSYWNFLAFLFKRLTKIWRQLLIVNHTNIVKLFVHFDL